MTGANSGIGKETARQLVGLDATVILACRSQSKAAATCFELRESHIVNGRPGLGVAEQLMGGKGVEPMVVDLADSDSIQRFVAEFKRNHDRLDALVNNAATIAGSLQHNQDGVELTFATNHAGPVLLTSALLPLLQRSGTKERPSRIVNVASRLERQGRCDPDFLAGQRQTRPLDPKRGYDPLGHYCDSKLCNMLYTRSLSSFLDERVTVAAVTPGMVNSGLFRSFPTWYRLLTWPVRALYLRTPAEAAEGVVWALTAETIVGESGNYYADGVAVEPSAAAQDDELAERLCMATTQLLQGGNCGSASEAKE